MLYDNNSTTNQTHIHGHMHAGEANIENNSNINGNNGNNVNNDLDVEIVYSDEIAIETEGNRTDVVIKSWENWTDIEVKNYIEMKLLDNGIKSPCIKAFMAEFSKHNITGKELKTMKNDIDVNALEQFKSKFENQSFDIWTTISKSIQHLP